MFESVNNQSIILYAGTAIDDCFTEFQCAGARVPSISQVTECCVNRSDGMSYRLLGECTDCIGMFTVVNISGYIPVVYHNCSVWIHAREAFRSGEG